MKRDLLNRPFVLPRGTLPAMHVPAQNGESQFSCAHCRFASADAEGLPVCTSELYQRWAGTPKLIDPKTGERVTDVNAYCSNWFEPAPVVRSPA